MSSYWEHEYIPEIAQTGIPREQQEKAYAEWEATKGKRAMTNLMRTFGKLINSEVSRYQGTLARPVLLSYAKKYMADAVKTYDASSGNQLSTHIVNNLQRLHRINYKHVQGLKTPENVQIKMNPFLLTKGRLKAELGRPPNNDEIAREMGVSPKFIEKMTKGIRVEVSPDDEQTSMLDMSDSRGMDIADYMYYGLPENYKKIFEYKTGYGGNKIIASSEIAKKMKISSVRIAQISKKISSKFAKYMGKKYR